MKILAVAILFAISAPTMAQTTDVGVTDYVQQTLDRITVVRAQGRGTYSIPGPAYGGGGVYTQPGRPATRPHGLGSVDYGPGYRNDGCASNGRYCGRLDPIIPPVEIRLR